MSAARVLVSTAAGTAAAREIVEQIPLAAGWELGSTREALRPDRLDALDFVSTQVPGTISGASDSIEYWLRCRFDADPAEPGEEVLLRFGGIATVSEAWLNGHPILSSTSMFAAHDADVSALLRGRGNELLIVCRSLTAALRAKRGHAPAARWRTRVVSEQQLRWFRTSVLGRAPGFAPGPPAVGLWRPVMLERRSRIVVDDFSRRVWLDGSTGVIEIEFRARALQEDAKPVRGRLISDRWSAPLEWDGSAGRAGLRIPDAQRWWPHTHGEPALHPLSLELRLADGSEVTIQDRPTGFRSIETEAEFGLKLNGVPIFCRGVVWTPADAEATRQRLTLLREGGFNLIRIPGTGVYESQNFHNLCDELGLLVWQDMMFANMDYPFADPQFLETVRAEASRELQRVGRHPSTAVICGNSEIEQQVGMLGLDPAMGRGAFFGEELPRIAAQECPGVPYVPSAPSGGDQPFRTNAGVANYFGVGAYLRPIEDARRAEVRFASECLAFSNVPEPEVIEKMSLAVPGGISPTHPAWKRTVPRDSGAGWDFEDVRDHYLKSIYGVDPTALRYADPRRYWELSRMVSGEVMAEVFGEWRRAESPCAGGIVLWSADLEPGAGWGILDSTGNPKAAYWFLKRALAPCAVWTTDEGLNGVNVHVANDRPETREAILRVALYRDGEHKVAEAQRAVSIGAQGSQTFGLEEILGRFVDASYAYRFGPPGHDLIAVSLHRKSGDEPFAQSFRFPSGRFTKRQPVSELGVAAGAERRSDGAIDVVLSARRFVWGVRVAARSSLANDCYFDIEPGGSRRITIAPVSSALTITAMNAEGNISIASETTA